MRQLKPLLAIAIAASAAGAAAQVEVGAVGGVNPEVAGTPPAAERRLLDLGDRLFLDERLVSGEQGLAQAMFLDQTTLTIAPNSDVVLDRYVYDPDADTGEIALSLGRGALRFIGGRITKSEDAIIRTATATIGVRGGVALISAEEDATRTLFLAGDYARITSGGETLTVSRPGALVVTRRDAAPEYLGVGGPETTSELVGAFQTAADAAALDAGARRAAEALAQNLRVASGAADLAPVSTSGLSVPELADLSPLLDGAEATRLTQTALFSDRARFADMSDGIGVVDVVDVGGVGLVRGQLLWRNDSDLDLHLLLPGGAGEVAFFNPQVVFNNGGATASLDIDNLGGIVNAPPDGRVENIAVTGSDIPPGEYVFFVEGFTVRTAGPSPFSLTVTGDGGATLRRIDGAVADNQQAGRTVVTSPGGAFVPSN